MSQITSRALGKSRPRYATGIVTSYHSAEYSAQTSKRKVCMSAVLESRIRSAVGLPNAPTPLMNHAVAAGVATSPSPSLRCPRCRRTLVPVREGELQCTRPARPHSYPIVAGIPDLRAISGADITVARERADARLVAEMLSRELMDGDTPSEEMPRHSRSYWSRLGLT